MTPAAIGIDIGGTQLRAATVTADGQVLDRTREPTPAADAAGLLEALRRVLASYDPGLPVGVGIAGLVTPDGVVRYGPNIGVRDLALASLLAPDAPGGVVVLNDASAAALGEQRVGGAAGRDDVVLFTLGTGVGGGIVIGGRLLVGHGGFAGELGHIVVADGGRRCPCGNRGCIEAYASGTALELAARERLVDPEVSTRLRAADPLDGRAVTAAAAAGDTVATDVLTEVGRWFGVAVATVCNALDPEVVLVGGGAAAATAAWMLPAAREAAEQRLVGHGLRALPPIELAELGDDAGMIGAAMHARATLVTEPR